jgi:hypothetical protein
MRDLGDSESSSDSRKRNEDSFVITERSESKHDPTALSHQIQFAEIVEKILLVQNFVVNFKISLRGYWSLELVFLDKILANQGFEDIIQISQFVDLDDLK